MKNMEKVELLAPAGNFDSFVAACNAGADAIYMGLGKHNARVMAKNFTEEEYIKAIDYAHLRGIKVYLTLNTLMYDDEIKEAMEMLVKLYSYGLDAVILQDIGFADIIRKTLPDLHLHASTQMSVYSLSQVKYLQSLGFKRVVLARELTLEEIKYICDNTDIEIEVFVHGALCVGVSGQCLLSSTIGGRSANRGRCAQPCRMKYSLLNSKNKVIVANTYVMSKKDIFGLDNIKDIINSGILSLKIEGRNKTPEYVALVVSKYRKYIDICYNGDDTSLEESDKKDIMQMFNRNGISSGYLKGVKYKDSITLISPKNTGRFLGTVISQNKMYIKVKLEEKIDLHDGIEIYSEEDVLSTIVTCIKDDRGNITNKEADVGEYVWIGDISKKVRYGSKVYKTSCDELNSSVSKKYVRTNINRRKINLDISILEGKRVGIKAYDDKGVYVEYLSDYIPDKAKNKALDKESVIAAFSKTIDTAFTFHILNLELDGNLFVPVSKLNEIRRNVVLELENAIITRKDIKNICVDDFLKEPKTEEIKSNTINSLYVYMYDDKRDYLQKYNNMKIDRLDISVIDYFKYEEDIFKKYSMRVKLAIHIPNFVLNKLDKYILKNLERLITRGIDTVILSSFSYIELVNNIRKKVNFNLVADYSFNISNKYSACFMKKLGFDAIVPAYDMNVEDIYNMSKYVDIEVVNDFATVMTSRYCILGSFIANREDKCSMPCVKEKYYLIDSYGYKYYIVCDNLDCIMRLVKGIRKINLSENNIGNVYCIRKAII